MRPFNLEEALAGNPVVLRNGSKAYVLGDLRTLLPESKEEKHLVGVNSEIANSKRYSSMVRWKCTGYFHDHTLESIYDIVGMWEEPKLPKQEILAISREDGKVVIATYKRSRKRRFVVVGESTNGILIVMTEDGVLRYISELNIDDAELEIE